MMIEIVDEGGCILFLLLQGPCILKSSVLSTARIVLGVSKIHSLRFPHNMSCGVLPMEVLSYGQVYDRDRLDEKKNIVDLLFTACMNPKAER